MESPKLENQESQENEAQKHLQSKFTFNPEASEFIPSQTPRSEPNLYFVRARSRTYRFPQQSNRSPANYGRTQLPTPRLRIPHYANTGQLPPQFGFPMPMPIQPPQSVPFSQIPYHQQQILQAIPFALQQQMQRQQYQVPWSTHLQLLQQQEQQTYEAFSSQSLYSTLQSPNLIGAGEGEPPCVKVLIPNVNGNSQNPNGFPSLIPIIPPQTSFP